MSSIISTQSGNQEESPHPHLSLKDKVAIVTGGSRGIGAGIALELAKRGANIIILYTSAQSHSKVSKICQEILKLKHKPKPFQVLGDLRKPEDIEAAMETVRGWIEKEFGHLRIDILVNNAGVELAKPLGNITYQEIDNVYQVNVRGAILMTQAVLPHLPSGGRIINISSVGSRAGFSGLSVYCSSKAALEGLTRCWAAELGVKSITVNAVNPGPVQSEMLNNIPKEIVDKQKSDTPVENRIGTIEEITAVVGWLAGEESRWVTGQTISASGGWAMY
ncbi:hypothetical protein B0O99DRAFT_530538 [Bisporella sp. PMI_857]|nr:hypothetical protein B0O99DRAFT_530538 [Bisporella sp. PMI_857]